MEVVPVQPVVSGILGRCPGLEKPRKSPWRISDPKSMWTGLNEKHSGRSGGLRKHFPGEWVLSGRVAAGVPPL